MRVECRIELARIMPRIYRQRPKILQAAKQRENSVIRDLNKIKSILSQNEAFIARTNVRENSVIRAESNLLGLCREPKSEIQESFEEKPPNFIVPTSSKQEVYLISMPSVSEKAHSKDGAIQGKRKKKLPMVNVRY